MPSYQIKELVHGLYMVKMKIGCHFDFHFFSLTQETQNFEEELTQLF